MVYTVMFNPTKADREKIIKATGSLGEYPAVSATGFPSVEDAWQYIAVSVDRHGASPESYYIVPGYHRESWRDEVEANEAIVLRGRGIFGWRKHSR